MKDKQIYKVVFHNQNHIYELYAEEIDIESNYAFVTVGGFVFGERSSLLVDPSEEQLKNEFSGVKRTYIPMHSVVRIDEVTKSGTNKIHQGEQKGKVASFPVHGLPPKGKAD